MLNKHGSILLSTTKLFSDAFLALNKNGFVERDILMWLAECRRAEATPLDSDDAEASLLTAKILEETAKEMEKVGLHARASISPSERPQVVRKTSSLRSNLVLYPIAFRCSELGAQNLCSALRIAISFAIDSSLRSERAHSLSSSATMAGRTFSIRVTKLSLKQR